MERQIVPIVKDESPMRAPRKAVAGRGKTP